MNTDELTELLLAYLNDKAEGEVHSFFFFPLGDFAAGAGITDHDQLMAAARALEDGGMAMLSQDVFGQVSALITMEGMSYVESGGETGIIARYRENPQAFIQEEENPSWLSQPEPEIALFTPEMANQVAPAGEPVKAETASSQSPGLKQVIIQIINVILDDTSLDDTTRADLLRDAETLNIQLAKTTRNRVVIDALMAELWSVPSLAHAVAQLSSYI